MRYTFVKQHDVTDCKAACLAMVQLKPSKVTLMKNMDPVFVKQVVA